MKQEQKLVAETYRYLAPFIDTSKPLYLSLDGQAALVGVGRGHFSDGTIPDLWFTVDGHAQPVLIEAKAMDKNNRLLLMQSQLRAWRTDGLGKHRPEFWIAANNSFDVFYFWRHADFIPTLDRSQNNQDTVAFALPKQTKQFKTINQLALTILRAAVSFD